MIYPDERKPGSRQLVGKMRMTLLKERKPVSGMAFDAG